MTRYSLFVPKVSLNTNKTNKQTSSQEQTSRMLSHVSMLMWYFLLSART